MSADQLNIMALITLGIVFIGVGALLARGQKER